MDKRERTAVWGMAAVAAVSLAVGIYYMILKGNLGQRLMEPESLALMGEMAVFFLWSLFCLRAKMALKWRAVLLVSGGFLFTWCHRIFLPLAVSGLYAGYLILLGDFVRRLLAGKRGEQESQPQGCVRWMQGLIWGSAVWILTVCLISAAGVGGVGTWRLLAAVTAVPLFGAAGVKWLRGMTLRGKRSQGNQLQGKHLRGNLLQEEKKTAGSMAYKAAGRSDRMDLFISVCLALLLTMLALQVGRLNIAVDYDSVHYGLRSPYILDNGRGIYENLGNINLVYTYSKGLEVLVLPLAGTATYGYVLSFNLWVTAGILTMVWLTARKLVPARGAWAAAAVTSSIPGIMNMGITAKTDSITLLFQMIFIYYMICYLEGSRDRTECFVTGSCACLLTYLMKPTSLVFTTAVYGMTLLYLLAVKQFRIALKHRIWLCAVPCVGAWLGIWARTWRLTGYPVTSVFSSVWELLGFKVRYPFAFQGIPDAGRDMSLAGNVAHLWDRLWKMMAAPVGEDMGHVVIAWGSVLIPVLLAALLLSRRVKKREYNYLMVLYLPLALISLISVHMLWQVDGNYFMLFYVLTVILAVAALCSGGSEAAVRAAGIVLVPVVFSAVLVTCVTNWSGSLGLTPVRIKHRGYYDHQQENYRKMADKGNEAIWNLLASDPRTRVIALGEHLEVVTFPCNVQSYYDVTGSGGNVWLVKKLDYFKEFLRYADIDYLYVQADDSTDGPRAAEIVKYMLEDGSLYDVKYEYGNMIARIDHGK